MRILDDNTVLDFIDGENNNEMPEFSTKQMQGHIDYKCGCKITQDSKGNSLFPCDKHYNWASANRNNIVLHKNIH